MTLTQRILALVMITGLAAACSKKDGSGDTSDLGTDPQKFGYAIGVDIGKSLTPVKDEVDVAALVQGLEETLAGKTPRMDDEAREKVKSEITRKLQQKQTEERTAKAAAAKTAGETFLAENGKRSGVNLLNSARMSTRISEEIAVRLA